MGIYACFPTYRWNGGRSIKLEGSDHAPVFTRLLEIPDISEHSTPSLSARYIPMIHGVQQTLGMRNFLILWLQSLFIVIYVHFMQLTMSSSASNCELAWDARN